MCQDCYDTDDEPCYHDCDEECYSDFDEWDCSHSHCFACGGCGCPGYCDDFQTYNLRPAETGGLVTCASPAIPAEPPAAEEPVRYPTFFDLVLDQPRYEAMARAYGSELPWETVRTAGTQQEGSELDEQPIPVQARPGSA